MISAKPYLLAVFLSVALLAPAGENLVRNGDFEEAEGSLPRYWDLHIWENRTEQVFFEVEEGRAKSGHRAFRLIHRDDQGSKLLQDIPVKPDTLYKFSAWIRAKEINTENLGAHISITYTHAMSESHWETLGEWVYVEIYGNTGEKQNKISISLGLGNQSSLNSGEAHYDDVEFIEVENVPAGTEIKVFSPPKTLFQVEREYRMSRVRMVYSGIFYALLCYLFYKLKKNSTLNFNRRGSEYSMLFAGFALALLFRIFFTYQAFGNPVSANTVLHWSNFTAPEVYRNYYRMDLPLVYPPIHVYIFSTMGRIIGVFNIDTASKWFALLMKLPAILADMGAGYLIYRWSRRNFRSTIAVALALLFLFNPAVLLNAVHYGQADSLIGLIVAAIAYSLVIKRYVQAAILFAVGVFTQPILIMMAPLGAAIIVRALVMLIRNRKSTGKFFLTPEFASGMKTLGLAALTFFAACVLIILPFSIQNPLAIVDFFTKALNQSSHSTLNAANIYALLGQNNLPDNSMFLMLSYKQWGIIVFLIISVVAVKSYIRLQNKRNILAIALLLSFSAFMFTTRMHERSLYPSLILSFAAFSIIKDGRLFIIALGITISQLLNVGQVLNLNAYKDVIASNNHWLLLLSAANLILYVYFVRVFHSICNDRYKYLEDGVQNPSNLQDVLRNTGFESHRSTSLKKDVLLCGSLMLVYSIMALYNLGTRNLPNSYFAASYTGEEVVMDLGAEYEIGNYLYLIGMKRGDFYVDFSQDGLQWEGREQLRQKEFSSLEWQSSKPDISARFVRITSGLPGAFFYEMGLFEKDSRRPIPVESLAATHPADARALVDEQDAVPPFISYLNGTYFDEIHYFRRGFDYSHGFSEVGKTHPPMGKHLISSGIALFGMNPFGWRFMGAFFGILMIPVMYAFGKKLFHNSFFAFFACFVFTFDLMHFTQTRMATLDSFSVFFIILTYYCMYNYYTMNFNRDPLVSTLKPLLFSGIFLGLGCATKWLAVQSGGGLAVLYFVSVYKRFAEYRNSKRLLCDANRELSDEFRGKLHEIQQKFTPRLTITLLFTVLSFIIMPFIIYFLSYMPVAKQANAENPVEFFLQEQRDMFGHHTNVAAAHNASSRWWEWPFKPRSMLYYNGDEHLDRNTFSRIYLSSNPIVWWVGIITVMFTFFLAFRRNETARFIAISWTAQYLPWTFTPRDPIFLYHFFATIPFMILSMPFVVKELFGEQRRVRIPVFVYMFLVFAVFLISYPFISGQMVGESYARLVLGFFRSH